MLRSLFGDLRPRALDSGRSPAGAEFAATQVMAGYDSVDAPPLTVASTDVVVDSSPAAAMRQHFARARIDLARSTPMLTLLDPSHLWAPQVIRALSDAGGRPVERLNLRERATLRTLALIERTVVPRRNAGPLRVYHADIRATGADHDEIANALAEGSHLTAVIVGALQPIAMTAVLNSLRAATLQPEWRCPWLVFIVPPGSGPLRERILRADWPPNVRVAAMTETLNGPSTVWNAVLTAWEATQRPASTPEAGAADAARAPSPDVAGPAATPIQRQSVVDVPPMPAAHLLRNLMHCDGMLACGIVDLGRGDLLASDCRDAPADELARAGAALIAARRAHLAASPLGAPNADELLVSAGDKLHLLRVGSGTGTRAIVALLRRGMANMALVRFRSMDVERQL